MKWYDSDNVYIPPVTKKFVTNLKEKILFNLFIKIN
jgi:hypothetical protein